MKFGAGTTNSAVISNGSNNKLDVKSGSAKGLTALHCAASAAVVDLLVELGGGMH